MTPFFKDAIDLNVNEFERVGWFVLLYALPFTSGLTRLRSRWHSVCAFSADSGLRRNDGGRLHRSRPVNGRIKSAMTGLSMYQSDKTMRLPLNLVDESCLGMVPENAGGGGKTCLALTPVRGVNGAGSILRGFSTTGIEVYIRVCSGCIVQER